MDTQLQASEVEKRLIELNARRRDQDKKPIRRKALAGYVGESQVDVTRALQGMKPDVLEKIDRRLRLLEEQLTESTN